MVDRTKIFTYFYKMKTIILFTGLIFLFFTNVHSQILNEGVGIGTTNPDSSAILELSSSNKGFLPTRVALSANNVTAPVVNPKPGLLVYNTTTAGVAPNNIVPGYYYWNGSVWYPTVNKAVQPGDMQYWDGTKWIIIPIGKTGETLTVCNGIPIWGSCNGEIIIKPLNNPNVGQLSSNVPNATGGAGGTQFTMAAWTSGGQPLNIRSILRFDYSNILPEYVIDSAKLFIYATLTPQGGNGVDPHFGPNNACYIRRITTPWMVPSPFSWNNPPAFSVTNEATIPQSTNSFENNIIDVTGLVKDMIQNGNNGFYIGLKNEVTYNVRQYASSFYSDTTRHPSLVIYYHR
jgi:hypothetical protein